MSTLEHELDVDEMIDGEAAAPPLVQRSPRISQAEIFRAADELLIEGRRPSIDRVRMHLGRGSPNTIHHHMEIWWTKLGARLRDLPERTFPQVPERVGHALQLLWNEALEGAHETLRGALLEREQAIVQQEQGLETRARALAEREQVAATRAASVEESLALIREQLTAANQRAENLETALRTRDAECVRQRERMTVLEESSADLREKLDAVTAAHQVERTKLEERYSAAEARWLTEVDRARQLAREAAKEHERQLKELRERVGSLQKDRDRIQQELIEARTDLKSATAAREHLEERLSRSRSSPTNPAKSRRKGPGKPKRPGRT
jgi:predicted  nucleic acid-binding Zn-ribbon protein